MVTRKVAPEMPTDVPQTAGTLQSVWDRDVTQDAYPEQEIRPDEVALTDEQKAHLKENGLR